MSITLLLIFIALLGAYVYSAEWSGVDSRYPIAMALGLLLVAAVLDALGDPGAASAYAVFVYFLLAGGLFLLLGESRRTERSLRHHQQRTTH